MRHRKLRHRQGCRGRSARLGKCSSRGERIVSNDSPIARPLIWGVFSASPGNARRSWRMPPGRGPRHEALRTLHAFGWASQRIPAPESTANALLLTSEYALQFHFPTELGMEPAVGVEPTTLGLQNRCSTTELSRPWDQGVLAFDCEITPGRLVAPRGLEPRTY